MTSPTDYLTSEQKMSLYRRGHAESIYRQLGELNRRALLDRGGFSLSIGPSQVSPEAGNGVFVEEGTISIGQIVALYPGTVYQPHQPVL